MTDFFSYTFIIKALIAGGLISICCALLGVFLVLRRLALIGDGLAHVSFGTIGLALFLNASPLFISLPLVMLCSLGLLKITEKTNVYGDTSIGIISSLGLATGIMLTSIAGGVNVDLLSFLFGNILAISTTEVFLTLIISILIISFVWIFYYDLFSITFDESYAKATGIKTSKLNKILILLTSLTIVLGIKVVGTLLISSLIILPAITALQIAKRFKTALILACILAICSVFLGILFAFIFNLPTGSTIVFVNFIFFFISILLKKIL